MNKLFSKIAVFAVGAAMAVGVGVAAFRGLNEVRAEETTATYTFTANTWAAETNWTGSKNGGNYTAGQGVQVTSSASPIKITSPQSYENITHIKVVYNTNKSAGAGTIAAKIGDGTSKSNAVAYTAGEKWGYEANYETDFEYTIPETGFVELTVTTTTNSIWVKSVAITYGGEYIDTRTEVELDTVASVTMNILDADVTLPAVKNKETEDPITGCSFETSNSEVVDIVDGKIKAINTGTATITVSKASDTDYKYVSTSFEVTVENSFLVSKLEFEAACAGAGVASDSNAWTITSDAAESAFDADRGIHYGTGSLTVEYVNLVSSSYNATVKKVVVNATDAVAKANITVTVGTSDFTCSPAVAQASPSCFIFEGTGKGVITVRVARPAAEKKAIYVKFVSVYGVEDTSPAISVTADKNVLAKDEVATLTIELLNGATGIPTYVADPAAAVALNPSVDGLTCTVTANSVATTTDVTITVSLADCADKQVTVTVKRDTVLTGIEIITNPTKVEYYQNATSVDLTGIVVHKTYDSGDPEVAELSELEVKSFDFSVIVTSTDVTIGLKGTEFIDTFSVAVVEKPAVAEKTVAEALTAGGALTPVAGETVKGDEMKVTGYVTRINNWTSHYGNADIYIADTVGGTPALQILRFNDQDTYEKLALGTQIKVTGTIAVYKESETADAKVEFVEVSETELLTTPSFTEMTVAEALTAGGALTPVAGQTVYDTKSVKVSGFLTSKGTWSGSYHNGDLYIADEKGSTPTLQILRFGIESVFNDLLVGAELEIKGILAIYKKDASTDAKIELTSPVVTVKGGGEVIELNVANALARGNALTEPATDKTSTFDTATVRITGYVVKQNEWSTQYNNADFWIADSVSDNDWLDIFRYGNKDIFDQCKPGAQVQVTGILALYKNGTKLTVELTGATVVVLTPAPELDPIETNVAGAIEACAGITPVAGQTVMLSNIQEYAVTGYVISSNWSTDYNNGSIWIVDSADAQKGAPEVQAYRFGDKDIFDQCIKGAKITITGLLGVYLKDAESNPAYELTNCSISDIVLPAVVPTSLDYEGELEKTEYEIGEDFDTTLAGITKFVVTYSDSTTEAPHTEDKTLADVTVDASAFDKTTAGDYNITVSYTEGDETVSCLLQVTVKPEEPGPGPEPEPVTLVDITVTNSKSNYQVGDILDYNAITVTMVYSDQSTREGVISTDYGFTFPEGFDGTFTAAGEVTIVVYAKADETIKKNVVLTVSAAPVVLTSITVETTVTEYTVGDQIDPNSITITAHYSDGTSEVVTTGFIVTFDSSEAGDNVEVTVSYTEGGVTKSASFYVTVKAAPSGKKGCGGDIAATSIILSTLSLAGVALLALKKRKED